MTIENNLEDYNIPMERIEVGECFIYNGCLHMKICSGNVDVNDSFPCLILNLETNTLNATKNYVLVKRINAKIVVE